MVKQKTAAAIHDISGYGKCSLTVVLPILSAAGIETAVMPTAVLSTHTGTCFNDYSSRDMTADMADFARHWRSMGLHFGAIYSGYLGASEQIDIVSGFIDDFKAEDATVLVDPVLGDNGKMYPLCTDELVGGMSRLCQKADIIVPNITEAALLTQMPYSHGNHSREYIQSLIRALAAKYKGDIVLTGVSTEENSLGSAAYSGATGEITFNNNKKIPGMYHGTGDIFASVLLCGIMCGKDLKFSAALATDFVSRSIESTYLSNRDIRGGVLFEAQLPWLMERLGLL